MHIAVLIGPDGTLGRATLDEILRAWSDAHGHTVDILTSSVGDALSTADGVVAEMSPAALDTIAALTPELVQRVVLADITQPARRDRTARPSSAKVVWGRGIETFRWAASALVNDLRSPAERHSYGDDPDQFGELRTPVADGPHPVIVLVHGGFWRSHWELDLMDDLAIDLTHRGYATWNLEYRRGRGSVSAALDDMQAGIDRLAHFDEPQLDEPRLDLDRVAVVGHSAGGHLAMLTASRSNGTVVPALCVGLAPVADLAGCAIRGLGEGAAVEFMGGDPDSMPDVYHEADPSTVPHARSDRIVMVQGLADSFDLIDMNRRYADAHPAAELIEVPDANHFHVIDPTEDAWRRAEAVIARRL